MKNRLTSYKIFNENSDPKLSLKEQWMNAAEKALDEKLIVCYDGIRWNEEEEWVDFLGDLQIGRNFKGSSIEELEFMIGNVEGSFYCHGHSIKTLYGCPKSCFDFEASNCDLTSLIRSPRVVNNFNVNDNFLANLNNGPKFVFGNFWISRNILFNLQNGPYLITGDIETWGNERIQKNKDTEMFVEMHKKIKEHYYNGGKDGEIKVVERIENDIKNKAYAATVLSYNPYFDKYLTEFKDEIEEMGNDDLKRAKDFGII